MPPSYLNNKQKSLHLTWKIFWMDSKFTVLRSRKIVRLSEQIISADKYQSIFLPQMETIAYVNRVEFT